MCICNMCYDDRLPVSTIIETVNNHKMLLHLCDECLVMYAEDCEIRLDGYIHNLAIDDFHQHDEDEKALILNVLDSIGLKITNWEDWRKIDKYIQLLNVARRVSNNSEYNNIEASGRRVRIVRADLFELLEAAIAAAE